MNAYATLTLKRNYTKIAIANITKKYSGTTLYIAIIEYNRMHMKAFMQFIVHPLSDVRRILNCGKG